MKLRHWLYASPIAAVLCFGPAAAQETDPVMESVRPHYERAKDYILRSAEQMSEDDLAFQPTTEVRSALGLLGHIADSQHYFCSIALGEETPHETGIERTQVTRAGMIEALRESFAYCDQAYAQSDAEAVQGRRLSQLVLNTAHNWEHYGNIVTYIRLRGQVPPSSQRRP